MAVTVQLTERVPFHSIPSHTEEKEVGFAISDRHWRFNGDADTLAIEGAKQHADAEDQFESFMHRRRVTAFTQRLAVIILIERHAAEEQQMQLALEGAAAQALEDEFAAAVDMDTLPEAAPDAVTTGPTVAQLQQAYPEWHWKCEQKNIQKCFAFAVPNSIGESRQCDSRWRMPSEWYPALQWYWRSLRWPGPSHPDASKPVSWPELALDFELSTSVSLCASRS